jgi:hypothetical protein
MTRGVLVLGLLLGGCAGHAQASGDDGASTTGALVGSGSAAASTSSLRWDVELVFFTTPSVTDPDCAFQQFDLLDDLVVTISAPEGDYKFTTQNGSIEFRAVADVFAIWAEGVDLYSRAFPTGLLTELDLTKGTGTGDLWTKSIFVPTGAGCSN